MSNSAELFARFVEIIAALRHPETGCPWDLEQTHLSLRPYLIEEAYEVIDAIENENDKELAGELGDVLLQVVLHAQVATDRGAFGIDDVITHVSDKMVRRHPHVFGTKQVNSSADVLKNWEQIKQDERKRESKPRPSALEGIPKHLPALLLAQRLGEKAAGVGFDWSDTDGVWQKVLEESAELKAELEAAATDKSAERNHALQHELGDVLFSLAQLARHLGFSAEDALRAGAKRFTERFSKVETSAAKPLKEYSTDELEELWQKAKRQV